MKVTEALRDAEGLAEFADLDPAGVAYFRNNYPDFAPSDWWDLPYRIDGTRMLRFDDVRGLTDTKEIERKVVPQWQHTQEQIRKAWKSKFAFKHASEVSDLLKLVFSANRSERVWNSSQVILPNGTIHEVHTTLQSFHKAVLYLHGHPRQAKICEECGRFFVHVHGKRELCLVPDARGETCAQKRINARKLKWWHKRGNKQRIAKQKRTHRGAHNA
ncbi:MAG TPA: hypothetical protein VNV41_16505 [Candidatus Acidoferrales bacterium]|nr:hypothetical protein [Candidatus Acidoferrales bacterium]